MLLWTQVLQAALALYWSLAIVDLHHFATPIPPQSCHLRIVQQGQSCCLPPQLLDHLNLLFQHLSLPLLAFHRLQADFWFSHQSYREVRALSALQSDLHLAKIHLFNHLHHLHLFDQRFSHHFLQAPLLSKVT